MSIFTRFECPRCQHVFVTEGDADAFADCPKCQSMALAIGEASVASAQPAKAKAKVSLASDDGPALATASGEGLGERGDGSDKGVFSQLLESTDAFDVQVDATNDNLRVPATLDDMPPTSDDGSGADPFEEATVAAEAPSALIERMRSGELASDPYSDEDAVHRAPTELLRPRNQTDPDRTEVRAAPSGDGKPAGLFDDADIDSGFDLPSDDEDAWEHGPPASVPTKEAAPAPVAGALLDEDAWDNGPPPGASGALPRPPSTGELPRRVQNAAHDLTRQDSGADPLSAEEFSLELHEEPARRQVGPGERRGVWDPNFHSGEMKAGAVLLSDLEAQFDGGVRLDQAAAEMSGGELNALEDAFSQVAGEPAAKRAEDALRQASFAAADSQMAMPTHSQLQGTAVPAPPNESEPPPLTRRKRPAHLSLSEEAKALAGIPVQPAAGSQNLALSLTRGLVEPPAPEPPPRPAPHALDVEHTEPRGRPAPVEHVEATAEVRPRPRPKPAAPPEPSTFEGFTALRVAAVVFVAVLLGLGTGAVIAPKPPPKPVTERSLAEQQFSQGNRFYEEQRYDDALGSYRGAIAKDRTFAPAYRAKAAALAKEKRGEEAASAYRTYLEMAPGAVDAEQVREVLRRYDGEGSP